MSASRFPFLAVALVLALILAPAFAPSGQAAPSLAGVTAPPSSQPFSVGDTGGDTARPVAGGFAPVESLSTPGFAPVVTVSKRVKVAAPEIPEDMGGRYAVMRGKRDTGCMVTLDDKSRVKGGARAQLAPGCRDQGIVIFDPTAWTMVKGELVLTARAGHKTHLTKTGEGTWQKDASDGGKPLGLKKL